MNLVRQPHVIRKEDQAIDATVGIGTWRVCKVFGTFVMLGINYIYANPFSDALLGMDVVVYPAPSAGSSNRAKDVRPGPGGTLPRTQTAAYGLGVPVGLRR